MKKDKTNLNAIDRRIYKYWQAFYLAFYSKRLYVDVAKRWRGFGLIYFLLVITIAALPVSITTIQKFNAYYEDQLLEPFKKVPTLEVVQGKLVFDYLMPYLVKNKNNEVVVVIDNKRNLTEINYVYPHWMLFVTADRLYFHPPTLSIANTKNPPMLTTVNSKDVVMQAFDGIAYEAFNGETWTQVMNLSVAKWYFLLAIYPVMIGMMYGFFSVLLFFMALMGQVVAYTMFRFKLGFKRTFRVMLVSSSCGVSLFMVSLSFGQLPIMGLCFMLMITLYFCYAIGILKRESKGLVLA